MDVNFYADLRPLAGGKTVTVDMPVSTTVRAVLEAATSTRPSLAEKIWVAPGELHQHIHVFVNGRQSVFLAQGLETPVQPGDTLDVFPPVGGGVSAG